MLFIYFLIRADISYQPIRQNALLTTYNQSKFLWCHTLILTHLLTNKRARTILIILLEAKG